MTTGKFEDKDFADWIKRRDAIPYRDNPARELSVGGGVIRWHPDDEMPVMGRSGWTETSWYLGSALSRAWWKVMEEFDAARGNHPTRNACPYCGNGFDA